MTRRPFDDTSNDPPDVMSGAPQPSRRENAFWLALAYLILLLAALEAFTK